MIRFLIILISLIVIGNSGKAQLSADFSANILQGCSPLIVDFTDASTGNITSWNWNFGNGNNSIIQNPSATYFTPGFYTVTLTVTDANGNTDTETKSNYIQVFRNPTVNFSANPRTSCIPATIQFSDNTALGDAPIQSWVWDFGNGVISTLQNPTYTYNMLGQYTIKLIVTDNNGCTSRYEVPNFIDVINVNLNTQIVTNDTVSNCGTPYLSRFNTNVTSGATYNWNFGDGTISTEQNPEHIFTNPGTYIVSLITTVSNCSDTAYQQVVVNSGNTIRVNEQNRSVCINENISFSYTTSNPIVGVPTWNFGDGNVETVHRPVHAFSSPGVYIVSVDYEDTNGCTIRDTSRVTVLDGPQVSLPFTLSNNCQPPFTVSFNGSAINATSWQWVTPNSVPTSSTVPNPVFTVNQAGPMDGYVLVRNNIGCITQIDLDTIVNTTAIRAVIPDTIYGGCAPATITFQDSSFSSSTIISHNWTFAGGNPSNSNATNPSVTFNSPGTYPISLTVTDNRGCQSTDTDTVQIGTPPIVNFSATPRDTCAQLNINFTNLSNTGNVFLWDFGDGGTSVEANPMYLYNDTGYFTVSLTVWNNGCPSKFEIADYIHITPTIPVMQIGKNCLTPRTFVFSENSIGADSLVWTLGDGTTIINQSNFSHTYMSNGIYPVTLTTYSFLTGCMRTTSDTIRIIPPSIDFIGSPLNGCAALNTSFTNNSNNYERFIWYFGDGGTDSTLNASHIYNLPGIYDVKLVGIDEYGCRDSLIKPRYVSVLGLNPTIGISPQVGCPPFTINFIDNTQGATSWLWNFGDGINSTIQNPSHTYTSTGVFPVKLIVSNGVCTDSVTQSNFIRVEFPNPNFVISDTFPCLGGTVRFYNTSIKRLGVNYMYEWNFGDGSPISTVENPTHVYNAVGIFNVTLRLIQNGICDSIITKQLQVVIPQANFTANPTNGTCPPLLVNFTNLSQYASEYYWNFGDGTSSTEENPSHIYTRAGEYGVTLIIRSLSGCYDTLTINPLIRLLGPRGNFSFVPTQGCIPVTSNFIATIDSANFISWDFGDGNVELFDTITNTFSISHVYPTVGDFYPSLILRDERGCVVPLPPDVPIRTGDMSIGFRDSITVICEQGNAFFFDTTFTTHPIIFREWNFGDGGTSAISNPVHNYINAGFYDVQLIVENEVGCRDTIIKPSEINVARNPDVNFLVSDTIGCLEFTASYFGSVALNAFNGNFSWNFGDGTPLINNILNPVHTFIQYGQFTTTLFAQNQYGCVDSIQKPIIVLPSPRITTGNDTSVCQGSNVQIRVISTENNFEWTPRDYLSCFNCANPFVLNPQNNIDYIVSTVNSDGCIGRDTIGVRVNPLPDINAISPIAICRGDSIQLLTNTQPSNNIIYNWIPQRDLTCYNCPNPVAYPQQNTLYTVSATISGYNCPDFDTVEVRVNSRPVGYAYGDTTICKGSTAQIGAVGGTQYSWTPAISLNSNSVATPQATPENTTNYIVNISNGFCSIEDSVLIKVIEKVEGEAYPDTVVCINDEIQLHARGGTAYSWTPASLVSNPNDSITFTRPSANAIFTVVISNSTCIPDTQQVVVDILSRPEVDAGRDTILISGQSHTLTPSSSRPVHYIWTPSPSLSCSECQNPVATPTQTTWYYVEGIDANGCPAIDSVRIQIIDECNGDIVLVPNAFTPNNDMANDKLFVYGQLISKINIFRVFNRWGELVFETDDITQGWDGTYKGQPVNSGVYVYYVDAICINGGQTIKKGNVTLMR